MIIFCKCSTCSEIYESKPVLSQHVEHHKDQFSQTISLGVQNDEVKLEFSEYLCFYCELKIESSKKLELHRRKCHVLSDFPCDQCGAQCKNIDDLGRHRTSYHGL